MKKGHKQNRPFTKYQEFESEKKKKQKKTRPRNYGFGNEDSNTTTGLVQTTRNSVNRQKERPSDEIRSCFYLYLFYYLFLSVFCSPAKNGKEMLHVQRNQFKVSLISLLLLPRNDDVNGNRNGNRNGNVTNQKHDWLKEEK